ncbi:MAG: sugar phosphate isomerase/epimerase [Alphaproteobacteria bacterium]|nr:sugar phosphate isomerase/epimerase [Alphaproteobacteria bacterium]
MSAPDPTLLSLNVATVRTQWSLEQAIEGCARHGIGWIAPWRDKLAECGLARAKALIKTHGLKVSSLCRGGMFPAADDAGRRAAIDDNKRAIDEAAELGAACLVLIAGGLPKGSKDIAGARAQVKDGIAALLEHARAARLPLAIEPLHPMYAADRACVNTLEHALDLCDALGAGLGVAVDVYHVWWDPDLAAGIERAGKRILGFHLCDWLVPTTDLLLDRGMMGDGVIDIPAIRRMVEAQFYAGPREVEIFSQNNWWKRDADEVMRTVKDRYASAT